MDNFILNKLSDKGIFSMFARYNLLKKISVFEINTSVFMTLNYSNRLWALILGVLFMSVSPALQAQTGKADKLLNQRNKMSGVVEQVANSINNQGFCRGKDALPCEEDAIVLVSMGLAAAGLGLFMVAFLMQQVRSLKSVQWIEWQNQNSIR